MPTRDSVRVLHLAGLFLKSSQHVLVTGAPSTGKTAQLATHLDTGRQTIAVQYSMHAQMRPAQLQECPPTPASHRKRT